MDIDYTRQYKHWHTTSLEHAKKMAASYRVYLEHLNLPLDANILDVGCGMGFFLLSAKEKGYTRVQGVDTSVQQISVARGHGLPAEHVEDVSLWLNNKVNEFDALFLFDVLEHIPVPSQLEAVAAFHKALKPGGVLFVRVPNANSTFAGRYRWDDWTHCCSFTEHSLDFVLYNGGFSNIAVKEDHFGRYPLWLPRPSLRGILRAAHFGIRRLQALAEFGGEEGRSIPLTINVVGIARK